MCARVVGVAVSLAAHADAGEAHLLVGVLRGWRALGRRPPRSNEPVPARADLRKNSRRSMVETPRVRRVRSLRAGVLGGVTAWMRRQRLESRAMPPSGVDGYLQHAFPRLGSQPVAADPRVESRTSGMSCCPFALSRWRSGRRLNVGFRRRHGARPAMPSNSAPRVDAASSGASITTFPLCAAADLELGEELSDLAGGRHGCDGRSRRLCTLGNR